MGEIDPPRGRRGATEDAVPLRKGVCLGNCTAQAPPAWASGAQAPGGPRSGSGWRLGRVSGGERGWRVD